MKNPTEPPTQYSLRYFIDLRLTVMEQQLNSLRIAIDQMANKIISSQEFEALKLQVAGLTEATQQLEGRLVALEAHNGMIRWVSRQIITVVVIVGIIYIISLLR